MIDVDVKENVNFSSSVDIVTECYDVDFVLCSYNDTLNETFKNQPISSSGLLEKALNIKIRNLLSQQNFER